MHMIQSGASFSMNRKLWVWVVLGILVRLVAINQPLLDAHAIRQCYTAACTQSILREPGFPLSSQIHWRGDREPRIALEAPIYNYLTIGAYHALHDLDGSGKVVSIALWLASFFVLQQLWRRCLSGAEAFWANALFVFSPISVFFSQAFSPEMLVQFLALSLVWRFLCYHESGRRSDFFGFAAIGCLGLLVKVPEIFHLWVFALALIVIKERGRLFVRWEYWTAGIATVLLVYSWSRYITPLNGAYDETWRTDRMLAYHFHTFRERLDARPYVRFASYVVPFLMAVGSAPGIALGAYVHLRERRWSWPTFWIASVFVYYMTWGFGPAQEHSYYQLPALAPCCYLFGVGMSRLRCSPRLWISRYAAPALAAMTAIFCVMATAYLFRQDRVIYDAAIWVRRHAAPADSVIFKASHDPNSFNFPHEPVFAYYADRTVWLDTTYLSPADRQHAEQTAAWVVETYPAVLRGRIEQVRRILKGAAELPKPSWLSVGNDPAWTMVHDTPQIRIYRRLSPASASDSSGASTGQPDNAGAERAPQGSSSSPPVP